MEAVSEEVPERVPIVLAARLLECHPATVYRYIASGDLRKLPRRPADHGKTMLAGDSVEALKSRCSPRDEAAS
jgi:hypothetical protein